jgi:uncharacterized SAM-binding protein YcdF (DUF218 family)
MAALVRLVFSFGGLLMILAAGGLWLARRPTSHAARRLIILAAVAYTLSSIYVIPYALSRLLVLGYQPLSASIIPPGRVAIVLLDGGSDFVENWEGHQFAFPARVNAARLWEAYRVYGLAPEAWVICSEGASEILPDAQPSGAVKQDALVRLGVPAPRILVVTDAVSTRDEAIRIVPKLRSLEARHVILVTSDTHMRRSLATFRALGIDAIPAITRDAELSKPWSNWLVPSEQGLGLTHEIVHEVLGLGYYTVRGWVRFKG